MTTTQEIYELEAQRALILRNDIHDFVSANRWTLLDRGYDDESIDMLLADINNCLVSIHNRYEDKIYELSN